MIGYYACIIMVPCFWLSAAVFAIGKERAANWLSGFHCLPGEEKAKYDRARMALDTRNDFLIWGGVMLAGALGARWISRFMALAAYGVWLVLFFRNVHLDIDKAFGKYKLPAGQDQTDRQTGQREEETE